MSKLNITDACTGCDLRWGEESSEAFLPPVEPPKPSLGREHWIKQRASSGRAQERNRRTSQFLLWHQPLTIPILVHHFSKADKKHLQPDYIWSPEDNGKSSKHQISGQKLLPSWRGGASRKRRLPYVPLLFLVPFPKEMRCLQSNPLSPVPVQCSC